MIRLCFVFCVLSFFVVVGVHVMVHFSSAYLDLFTRIQLIILVISPHYLKIDLGVYPIIYPNISSHGI